MTESSEQPVRRTKQEYEELYARFSKLVEEAEKEIKQNQEDIDEARRGLDDVTATLPEAERTKLTDSYAGLVRAQEALEVQHERFASMKRRLEEIRSILDRM